MKLTPVALGVVDAGTEQVTPVGDPSTAQVSVTVPVKLFKALACTERAPDPPSFSRTLPAVVEVRLKSVVFSCKLFEDAVVPEESPVIWNVVVCKGVTPAVVVTVTVEELPGKTVGGFAEHDMPAGRVEQPTVIG